jgi:hypothetical protein
MDYDRMISEFERKWLWPALSQYHDILLEGQRELRETWFGISGHEVEVRTQGIQNKCLGTEKDMGGGGGCLCYRTFPKLNGNWKETVSRCRNFLYESHMVQVLQLWQLARYWLLRCEYRLIFIYKCSQHDNRILLRVSGSIVSDYGLDDRGSIPDRGRGFFL